MSVAQPFGNDHLGELAAEDVFTTASEGRLGRRVELEDAALPSS